MKITLEKAHELLENAYAVILPDFDMALTYPSLSSLTDEPENEWCYMEWVDEKGYEFQMSISQEPNNEVEWDGDCLILIDDEGEPVRFRLLIGYKTLSNLKVMVNELLLNTTNDILTYLTKDSDSLECYARDICAKLNDCRQTIQNFVI
jgi:hypothetical protein